jgi:hypothetical protein
MFYFFFLLNDRRVRSGTPVCSVLLQFVSTSFLILNDNPGAILLYLFERFLNKDKNSKSVKKVPAEPLCKDALRIFSSELISFT